MNNCSTSQAKSGLRDPRVIPDCCSKKSWSVLASPCKTWTSHQYTFWCWILCTKSATESSLVTCPLLDDEVLEAKLVLDREAPSVVYREYLLCMAALAPEFPQEIDEAGQKTEAKKKDACECHHGGVCAVTLVYLHEPCSHENFLLPGLRFATRQHHG